MTWPLAEGCFCGLEAGGLAEVGRGRRAYKNGQHVPRKELVPCPSSKEGPSSESTLPFLAFSFTTRGAVRSFPVRPVASLLAYRAQTAPAPSTGTCTSLDALDCRERDITSTDGLDTHIHDQIRDRPPNAAVPDPASCRLISPVRPRPGRLGFLVASWELRISEVVITRLQLLVARRTAEPTGDSAEASVRVLCLRKLRGDFARSSHISHSLTASSLDLLRE